MTTRRLFGTAAGTAALLLGGCGRAGQHPDTAAARAGKDAPIVVDSAQRSRFTVEPVGIATYTPSIITTGTVAFSANLSTQVLAPISGPVSRILVRPGDRVTVGQPLATVTSPDFASAISNYRKADAVWRNVKKIADLNEQLFANDALARRDLDQSRTDLAGAAADREAALQQLHALGVGDRALNPDPSAAADPIEAAVRAPIEGTVVEQLINPGQLLQGGTTPTFTIADTRTVWVMANVFERDIRGVKRGDRAMIVTDASPDSLVGRVDYVADLVDPASKATQVRLVVPNKQGLLKRDMLVQVVIKSAVARHGVLVPVTAVLRDDENLPYLFVATAEGSFARRRIELGGRVDARYEVTSGLAAGDRVVVDGALYLQAMGEQ